MKNKKIKGKIYYSVQDDYMIFTLYDKYKDAKFHRDAIQDECKTKVFVARHSKDEAIEILKNGVKNKTNDELAEVIEFEED